MEGKPSARVVVGCTGSVATIKVPQLVKTLSSLGISVIVVPTQNALKFFLEGSEENVSPASPVECTCTENVCQICNVDQTNNQISNADSFVARSSNSKCLECNVKMFHPELRFVTDTDEWASWKRRGDPIQHIELRDWGDLLLLAPLDANTLAKVAQGICDNLLTCIIRAWDLQKPVVFCPAMNTQMYLHPYTEEHVGKLKALGFHEVSAISKKLMCGEVGIGAMATVDTIVDTVVKYLKK